jgi:hypothetical protein
MGPYDVLFSVALLFVVRQSDVMRWHTYKEESVNTPQMEVKQL